MRDFVEHLAHGGLASMGGGIFCLLAFGLANVVFRKLRLQADEAAVRAEKAEMMAQEERQRAAEERAEKAAATRSSMMTYADEVAGPEAPAIPFGQQLTLCLQVDAHKGAFFQFGLTIGSG